jgi:phage-related protein
MTLPLNPAAILEKNRVSSTGAWLFLLEIFVSALTDPIKVVRNTENIVWPTGTGDDPANTWVAFPFELGEFSEDGKETPKLELKVSNVTQDIQRYLEEADGGVNSKIILRVVHSQHLDQIKPEIYEEFMVQSVKTDINWVTFGLSGDFSVFRRVPLRKYLKYFCPYQFTDVECGYTGVGTCNKTLANCKALGNSLRFGGEPVLPGGLYD